MGNACRAHGFTSLHWEPGQFSDASQHGAPERQQLLVHQAHSSCITVTNQELFPPLTLSLGTCIIFDLFSVSYTLLSRCFQMHLVSKVLSSCSVNPILLELHRVPMVAPGNLGGHRCSWPHNWAAGVQIRALLRNELLSVVRTPVRSKSSCGCLILQ